MLHGEKLAQYHAVIHAAGGESDNLFELRDGLVENFAGGGRGSSGIFAFAKLAQVNAAQELVGVDVVGRGLEQGTRRHFGIMHMAGRAEVEIGQRIGQLG